MRKLLAALLFFSTYSYSQDVIDQKIQEINKLLVSTHHNKIYIDKSNCYLYINECDILLNDVTVHYVFRRDSDSPHTTSFNGPFNDPSKYAVTCGRGYENEHIYAYAISFTSQQQAIDAVNLFNDLLTLLKSSGFCQIKN